MITKIRTSLLALLIAASLSACGDDEPTLEDAVAAADEEHTDEEADVVVLDSMAIATGGIMVTPVETVQTTGIPVTGSITYDARRVSHIGPRIDGRIVRLVADIGDQVSAGQALAILESAEVGQVRVEEREAESLVQIARENYQREERLEQQGISSRKELLDAAAELRRQEAALQSARERLRVLGAGHGDGGQYALTSPFAGVVVAREASLGEMASPADQIFTVANLSRLWIELDIYERDLSRVTIGQTVAVSTAAYPNRVFPGRIVYVGDVLDPQKRTVRARVEIPNDDRALKPGMFASALIQVGGTGTPVVVVPQAAVQELEGRQVVFVPGDRRGEFAARTVEVGEQADNGRVVIIAGLEAGDSIVTSGAFALRSELAEGEIGDHGH
ncbi:MAG: efflux RND transporter periplasmic adaptor subunit [Longimicrobiales bacterium]